MQKITVFWQCVRACVKACVNWVWQNRLSILLVMVGAVLFIALIAVMFSKCADIWVMKILGTEDKRDTIQFVGLGIAGVLAIFGSVAVSKRANAQIKNNELVERGHIQERFRAAVEHLGNKEESVRIASFYEFYHLALDDEGVRKNIFDILRANLRLITASDEYKEKVGFVDGKKDVKTTQEVRCLLDVLFRAKGRKKEFVFVRFSCNLKGLFLVGANLPKANLRGVKMQDVDLRWADLRKADLQETDLQDADLRKADLRGADLRGVKNLETAKLNWAKIKGAIFPEGYEPPADADTTSDD